MEFATVQNDVMRALEEGNTALARVQSQLSLEDAERIMEENAEGIAYAEELSDILSQGLSEGDEEDLMAELDAMIADANPQTLPEMPQVPIHMPEVPTHDVEPVVEEGEPQRQEEPMLA